MSSAPALRFKPVTNSPLPPYFADLDLAASSASRSFFRVLLLPIFSFRGLGPAQMPPAASLPVLQIDPPYSYTPEPTDLGITNFSFSSYANSDSVSFYGNSYVPVEAVLIVGMAIRIGYADAEMETFCRRVENVICREVAVKVYVDKEMAICSYHGANSTPSDDEVTVTLNQRMNQIVPGNRVCCDDWIGILLSFLSACGHGHDHTDPHVVYVFGVCDLSSWIWYSGPLL